MGYGDNEIFDSYDASNNKLSIIMKVSSTYSKYYVDNYSAEQIYDFYLNNFDAMLKKLGKYYLT